MAGTGSARNFRSKAFIAKRGCCGYFTGGKANWIGWRGSDSSQKEAIDHRERKAHKVYFFVFSAFFAVKCFCLIFETEGRENATQESLSSRLRLDGIFAQVGGITTRSLCDSDSRRVESDRAQEERHSWVVDHDPGESRHRAPCGGTIGF